MSVVGGIAALLRGVIVEAEGVIVGPEPLAAAGGPDGQLDFSDDDQSAQVVHVA